MSKLDQLYRSLLLTKFFTKGWGKPDNLKRIFEFRKIISSRETCQHLVPNDYPVHIDKDVMQKECRVINGHFVSPFTEHLPGIMPKEVEVAHFQMILPKKWDTNLKPVCVHLAGTGDHYYWRRRTFLARPLLKDSGIASIILENPYYGVRKPKQQLRSSLHNVSDLFVMGGALVLESMVLFHWCERQGFGPLGITGLSMGGHMASLAATNWPKPLVLVPCLSWSTASSVFTEGVMSGAIPWGLLEKQFGADNMYLDELAQMIHSPELTRKNAAFHLGQKFAQDFPGNIAEMRHIQQRLYKGVNDDVTGKDCVTEYQQSVEPNPGPEQQGGDGSTGSSPLKKNVGAAQYHTSASALGQGRNEGHHRDGNGGTLSWVERLTGSFSSAIHRNGREKKDAAEGLIRQQAVQFMCGVMDECTHLANFSVPVDPELIVIVVANSDAYVPRDSVLSLAELWPGAEVRSINSGHIGAFLFKQGVFRKAITDGFKRHADKYCR